MLILFLQVLVFLGGFCALVPIVFMVMDSEGERGYWRLRGIAAIETEFVHWSGRLLFPGLMVFVGAWVFLCTLG